MKSTPFERVMLLVTFFLLVAAVWCGYSVFQTVEKHWHADSQNIGASGSVAEHLDESRAASHSLGERLEPDPNSLAAALTYGNRSDTSPILVGSDEASGVETMGRASAVISSPWIWRTNTQAWIDNGRLVIKQRGKEIAWVTPDGVLHVSSQATFQLHPEED